MKLALEILAGQRQGGSEGAPLVYVNVKDPRTLSGIQLRRGDMWIRETDDHLFYWNGKDWRQTQ